MKSAGPTSSAVISADPEFRRTVTQAAAELGLTPKVELQVNPGAVTPAHIKQVRLARPSVVILDLAEEGEMGCRLAEHLGATLPSARVVVASADQSPSLIKAALRAGAAEFLEKPLTAEAVREALKRLVERLRPPGDAPRPEGRVVTFLSPKGGAGSTTVATNFAIHLRRLTEERVILVDLDLELGEVAIFLGVEPQYSIVDIVQNLHRLDEGLLGTFLIRHDSGLEVLAAPYEPRSAAGVTPDQIRRSLAFLKKRYDHVIVDASNTLSHQTVAALEATDEVFLVTQVDVPSIRNIQRCRDMIRRSAPDGGPPVRVVVNRFQPRGEIALKDVEEALEQEVYWTLSNDYDSVVLSINTGKPLVMNVPCACSREIEALVARHVGLSSTPAPRRKGLLARVAGRLRPGARERRPALRRQSLSAPEAPADASTGASAAAGGESR